MSPLFCEVRLSEKMEWSSNYENFKSLVLKIFDHEVVGQVAEVTL